METSEWTVAAAQRDMRTAFLGGFMGQAVSALLWLASGVLATWGTPRQAIVVLVLGGFLIFPLTQLGLRLTGYRGRAAPGNPLNMLGFQVAMVLPLSLPVVGAVAVHHLEWFYPAFMVVLGAHYLPFVFLYGMPLFYGLGGALVTLGVLLALHGPESFALGAWVTAALLACAAVVGRLQARREMGAMPAG